LGYQEHLDYGLVQSTNPEFNKATVRVNVFRDHRQTIQVCNFVNKVILLINCDFYIYKYFQKYIYINISIYIYTIYNLLGFVIEYSDFFTVL